VKVYNNGSFKVYKRSRIYKFLMRFLKFTISSPEDVRRDTM